MKRPVRRRSAHTRLHGAWMLFREWVKHPRRIAAVAPSGADLAEAMVAELPAGSERVIELGGGTGAITRALLAHGIAGRGLLVVELNEGLHAHLRRRFTQVRIELGDAGDLQRIVADAGFDIPADAVVSSLGLLAMAVDEQRRVVEAAFACLRADGRFIQFTYGPQPPLAEAVVQALGLQVRRGEFVLRNVPPATVYVYSR